jgi:hypothetical protein
MTSRSPARDPPVSRLRSMPHRRASRSSFSIRAHSVGKPEPVRVSKNYLGFPVGISGQALTGRACVQAQKFGARVVIRARPLDLFHTIWSDLVRRYFDIGQRSARLLTIQILEHVDQWEKIPLNDYSLNAVVSRPAGVGETLATTSFNGPPPAALPQS